MIASVVLATAMTLSGVVATEGGRGVKNIPVSNGDTIVITDKKGRYTLPVVEDMCVFPVLDGNWQLKTESMVGNSAMPYFDEKNPCSETVDFVIEHKPYRKNFTVNAIGDVQVGDSQELDYAARTLWPELMDDKDATFNLWLGDLVNNNVSLYPTIREMIELLPQQSWVMVGNHDRDVDEVRTRQTASFGREFGAPVYAFTEGNVTFIVLNNVYGEGKRGYKGRLEERQLRFLANMMKILPRDRRIVLSAHIPFAYIDNKEELLDILKGRGEVLALTGHMHAVTRNFLKGEDVTIHELVGGASCGFWWVGERDWEGVPSALMQCGTPKGYFRFNFTPKGYDFSYKPTSQDAGRQASIWIAGADTVQTHVRDIKELERGEMLITVYGGCDSTRVVVKLDNELEIEAEKAKIMDPNVALIREQNLDKIYPTRYSRKNPFRHTASPQIWRVRLPEKYATGTHGVEVTASDRYGLRSHGGRVYHLE